MQVIYFQQYTGILVILEAPKFYTDWYHLK